VISADFVEVDGRRLEVLRVGPTPEKAPTLVLLHEGLGCVALWRDFPQRLAAATGFGVVAYSRFGYGASGAAELPRRLDYLTREAVDVLPKFLTAIGFRRGALIGHSDGATIAVIHAGAICDPRVKGVALMAPHLFVEPEGLAAIVEARKAYEQGELKVKLQRCHRDVDAAFRGWSDVWLDPSFRDWNVAGYVERWRAPALVIQGKEDQYGTLAQVREIERRAPTPVETLILPDCKHQPHLERGEQTIAAIAKFARTVLTPSTPEVATVGTE
jgi:pimeloyl-ACP methyl ester carboxylesterase